MPFLGFSAEATAPAGYLLMTLLRPVRELFQEKCSQKKYCSELDSIFIVFVCTSKEMKSDGFYKDRKYVSHKGRYADMRLNMDYDLFIESNNEKRMRMMWDVIKQSVEIVFNRVPSLKKDELIQDIKHSIYSIYHWTM